MKKNWNRQKKYLLFSEDVEILEDRLTDIIVAMGLRRSKPVQYCVWFPTWWSSSCRYTRYL